MAVWSPWYEPPPTRKNCATAAPPASTANVNRSEPLGAPLAKAGTAPASEENRRPAPPPRQHCEREQIGAARSTTGQSRHGARERGQNDCREEDPGAARELVAPSALAHIDFDCVFHPPLRLRRDAQIV